MNMVEKNNNGLVLGLDVSTKTIGIALFDDLGDTGRLKLLHHVTPKIKPLGQVIEWDENGELKNV